MIKLPAKRPNIDMKKVLDKSSDIASQGVELAKKGASAAQQGIKKSATVIGQKGKEAQVAVITFVDRKKNARFLKAKLSAFEDGIKEGKIQSIDYIKRYANFCLAATAISYFFARCDGIIDESERLEIQFDLDSIVKNKDLPEALRNKLAEISSNEQLSFDEVKLYLDGVSIDTLNEFAKDIDEIIFADGILTTAEQNAKAAFDEYLAARSGGQSHE